MTKWRDCKLDPPEEGKIVLCEHYGDFYTARRIKDRYLPPTFVTHIFCKHLQYPLTWSEIDFPERFTGRLFVGIEAESLMTLPELKEEYPESYEIITKEMISKIGDQRFDRLIRRNYKDFINKFKRIKDA